MQFYRKIIENVFILIQKYVPENARYIRIHTYRKRECECERNAIPETFLLLVGWRRVSSVVINQHNFRCRQRLHDSPVLTGRPWLVIELKSLATTLLWLPKVFEKCILCSVKPPKRRQKSSRRDVYF